MGVIRTKRAYDESDEADGTRILVDRLWPRGIKKQDADVDIWMKDLAPSTDLRKWLKHGLGRWSEFKRRYEEELAEPERQELLQQIADMSVKGNVTLLYASKNTEENNAVVVKQSASEMAAREGSKK